VDRVVFRFFLEGIIVIHRRANPFRRTPDDYRAPAQSSGTRKSSPVSASGGRPLPGAGRLLLARGPFPSVEGPTTTALARVFRFYLFSKKSPGGLRRPHLDGSHCHEQAGQGSPTTAASGRPSSSDHHGGRYPPERSGKGTELAVVVTVRRPGVGRLARGANRSRKDVSRLTTPGTTAGLQRPLGLGSRSPTGTPGHSQFGRFTVLRRVVPAPRTSRCKPGPLAESPGKPAQRGGENVRTGVIARGRRSNAGSVTVRFGRHVRWERLVRPRDGA